MAKILVVDDESNILTLYLRELRDEGYDVLTAVNAREALELYQCQRPDLVVLDIRLPGMDGLEAIGHMLSIDRRVPVVFTSAYAHYKDNFLSWSADAYVDKSSDLAELKRTIKDLLITQTTSSAASFSRQAS